MVLQILDRLRPGESIVVEEAPTARSVMQARMTFTRSQSFFTMHSGGLGYGMPAAVDVALARRDQRVIAIMGDGSSIYSIQALWSAAQLSLPIVFLILNNSGDLQQCLHTRYLILGTAMFLVLLSLAMVRRHVPRAAMLKSG